jgi:hypothetical protein
MGTRFLKPIRIAVKPREDDAPNGKMRKRFRKCTKLLDQFGMPPLVTAENGKSRKLATHQAARRRFPRGKQPAIVAPRQVRQP